MTDQILLSVTSDLSPREALARRVSAKSTVAAPCPGWQGRARARDPQGSGGRPEPPPPRPRRSAPAAEAGPGGSAAAPARPRSAATRREAAGAQPGLLSCSRRRDGAGAALPGLELLQAEEVPGVRGCLLAAAGEAARRAGSGGRAVAGGGGEERQRPRPGCLSTAGPPVPAAAAGGTGCDPDQRGGERWAAPSSRSWRPGSAAPPRSPFSPGPGAASRGCGSSSDTPRGSRPGSAPKLRGGEVLRVRGTAGELP